MSIRARVELPVRRKEVALVFLFFCVATLSIIATSRAQTVGVGVGDWIKYSYSGSAPFGADWIRVVVTSVDGYGQVRLKESYHQLDGTVFQDPRDFTFTVGKTGGNFSIAGGPAALPADSSKGFTSGLDLGYGYHTFVIDEEMSKEYAGKSWNVVGIQGGYNFNDTTFTAYWDKPTGWLLEFSTYYKGELWSSFVATDTNIGNEGGNASSITLSATSTTTRTDSTKVISVKAAVKLQDGSPVPDGTPVQFTLIPFSGDLGGAKLSSDTGNTVAGLATTTLMAPTQGFWSGHDPSKPDQNRIILDASCGGVVSDPITINILPMCTVSFQTDQASYEQGMAVIFKGLVFYNGTGTAPDDSLLSFDVTIPGAEKWNYNFNATTGTSGNFTVMPFAGWNTGTYKVKARVTLTIQNGEGGQQVYRFNNVTSFEVVQSVPQYDYTAQLDALTKLYKASIPDGPIRTNPHYHVGWIEGPTHPLPPEIMYGCYENAFIQHGPDDPYGDFTCGGYQTRVLEFFDSIRFNKDPAVRALLKGLDYGPIQMFESAHVAVTLYVIGFVWNGLSEPNGVSVVFDPWITQRAEVYKMKDWGGTGYWHLPEADQTKVAVTTPSSAASGYPITGDPICPEHPYLKGKLVFSSDLQTSVLGRCPVDMLVTDSQGRRVGMLPNGTLIQEFPAFAERYTDANNQTVGWYFGLGSGVYSFAITGHSSGEFQIIVSGAATGGKAVDYGNQTITKGARASLTLGAGETQPAMTLPDGSKVTPKIIQSTASNSTGGGQASFVVSGLQINPLQVDVGGVVDIRANVTNTGQTGGTYNTTLIVNNQVVGYKVVTLSPGQTTAVGWHTTSAWMTGSYDVDVGGQTGTFTIVSASTQPSGGSGSGSNGVPAYPSESVVIGVMIGVALLVYSSRARQLPTPKGAGVLVR